MAEVEYGGIKVGGSKLLLIIPLIGTLGGGLWAGFEFYKDYMDMKNRYRNMLHQTYQSLINNSQYYMKILKLQKKQLQYLKMRLSLSEIV